jgi:hypothetical protein
MYTGGYDSTEDCDQICLEAASQQFVAPIGALTVSKNFTPDVVRVLSEKAEANSEVYMKRQVLKRFMSRVLVVPGGCFEPGDPVASEHHQLGLFRTNK